MGLWVAHVDVWHSIRSIVVYVEQYVVASRHAPGLLVARSRANVAARMRKTLAK